MENIFQGFLDALHEDILENRDGNVADYIPELAKVNIDDFGIAIATVDGHVYQAGHTQINFSIQSISKAFTYGMALEDQGLEHVFSKVDVEPSGEAFNSISLESDTGRPRNPMINAGAIATTSMVEGNNGEEKIAKILKTFALYTGHEMEVDELIYLSEKTTGHRNRAISHLLRNYDIIENDPEESLDAYFQQCSIKVNCRDLALMGASLANTGVNPITGIRTLADKYVANVLSVMTSCGMYDYSGNWTYNVGMPAKSGVGGGIVAVLPGQFGLAVYSPRLDIKGNSVRGIAVCEKFSRQFGLHMLHAPRITRSSVIRTNYKGSEVHSKKERLESELSFLAVKGKSILVYELMGELSFVPAELIISEVSLKIDQCHYLILDFSRVTSIDNSASHLLTELVLQHKNTIKKIYYVGLKNKFNFSQYLKKNIPEMDASLIYKHDLDHALEQCEDSLLTEEGVNISNNSHLPFAEQPLCEGMSEEEKLFLESLTTMSKFNIGETVCNEGDPAEDVYFPQSGKLSVWLRVDHQRKIRLSGTSIGWIFGESALLVGKVRSADIIADTDVTIQILNANQLLSSSHPLAQKVQNKLYKNLAALYDLRLRRASQQIRALSL